MATYSGYQQMQHFCGLRALSKEAGPSFVRRSLGLHPATLWLFNADAHYVVFPVTFVS
jgi:hypothetical protein